MRPAVHDEHARTTEDAFGARSARATCGLKKALLELGHEVVCDCDCCHELISCVRSSSPPDLIVTGVDLVDGDGIQTLVSLGDEFAIPAIVDDGFALWESLAINLYLARKAGKLWPANLQGEALMYQWTMFAATEVEPLIGQWFYHTLFLAPEKRKPELVEDAAARLPAKFEVLEGALTKSPWLAGPEFTIADLNVAAVMFRAPKFGIDRWPHVKDWHARCTSRPAALEALKLREKAVA